MAKNWKELDKKNWRVDVGTPLKIAINAAEKTRLHVTPENQLVMNGEVIGTGKFASFASGDAVFTLTAANNGSEIVNALKLTYPDGRETTTAEDLKEALDYCHQCGMYLVDRSTNARVYVDYGSTGSYYGLWEAGATYVMDFSKMGYPTKMRFLTLKFDETNKRFSVLSGLELFQELSSVKKALQLLDKYGFIGTFSSWNRLSGLTTDATSEQILTALQLKRIGGNVITDPSEANDIFNSCAVFGKYIQDNSTRSKVQIEYVSNYFVMTEMYSQPYKKDDDTYSYRPILRTVSLTYSSIKGFAIRDVARDFPLYDVVGLAAIKAAVPNKIECFTLNSSYLPTEGSGSNFAVYLNEYAKMARIAAAGGNVRVDAGTGTYGHTYVNLLDSLIVRYVSDTSFRLKFEYKGKEYFFANDGGTLRNNITNITTTSERIAALEARVAALENK